MLGFFPSDCRPKNNKMGIILGSSLQHCPALGTLLQHWEHWPWTPQGASSARGSTGPSTRTVLCPSGSCPFPASLAGHSEEAAASTGGVIPLPFPTSGPFRPRPTHSSSPPRRALVLNVLG